MDESNNGGFFMCREGRRKQINRIKRNVLCVNWRRDTELIKISHQEFNAKIAFVREHGTEVCEYSRKEAWSTDYSYAIEESEWEKTLYVREDGKLVRYTTSLDERKNDRRKKGVKGGHFAFSQINERLMETTGASLYKAFGYVPKDFKRFVPAPLLYQEERHKCCVLHGVKKADVSSAFPYQATLKLPDSHRRKCKIVKGRVGPSEEFPFAFYLKSNHLAIYGEFDTHDYKKHHIVPDVVKYIDVPDDEEETMLMPASKYSLKDIMQELYDKRKEDADCKSVMVSFFGYLQSTKYWNEENMAHITAVVITRSNERMHRYVDNLIAHHNQVYLVMTDSIAWKGNCMDHVDREKGLGKFYLEYEDVDLAYTKFGQYCIQKGERVEILKHQGVDEERIMRSLIEIRNLKQFIKAFGGPTEVAGFDEDTKQFIREKKLW